MSNNIKPVEINLTARDGFQANHGTNTTAEEIVCAYANAHDYGVASFQTTGGTFHDLLVKKGRDPFEFNKTIGDHFQGLTQSALIRGECGLSYSRQPLDVLEFLVAKYSAGGVNVWQNFHAMNDIEMMRGVPLVVNGLREKMGLYVHAQGGITIQENPNTKAEQQKILSDIYMFARDLKIAGHKDFYLKNANGILRPDFVFEVVQGLNERFDEKTYLHMHNTYGLAYENYMAAIEAGVSGVDVLPDALAEGTAQPALGTLIYAMENSGNDAVISRLPTGINMDAINKDRDAMIITRATYSKFEMPFNQDSLAIAKNAGSAGGAISALKGMDTVVRPLASLLDTDDWSVIQAAIYEQKSLNREGLGYPTNVTPHELMQDIQAAVDVLGVANGGQAFDVLAPVTMDYLTGGLGNVSDSVDPKLQKRALELAGLDNVIHLKPIEELEPGLPIARERLMEAGIDNPTFDQSAIVASSGDDGFALVMGHKELQQASSLLMDQQKGGDLYDVSPEMFRVAYAAVELTKLRSGFYQGVNSLDQRADDLECEMMHELSSISEKLADGGYDVSVVNKANRYISSLASGFGADSANIMRVDVSSFERAYYDSGFAEKKCWDGGEVSFSKSKSPKGDFEAAALNFEVEKLLSCWDAVGHNASDEYDADGYLQEIGGYS